MSLPPRYVSIEEECKRNPELKMSDLLILKDWINKEPHLPNIEMLYFVLFLHKNHYNVEKTKRMVENFLTLRTHMPEIFCNRDVITWKELRKTCSVITAVPLEQETKEGYMITFCKLLDTNPSVFNLIESVKYVLMTCEVQNLMKGINKGHIIILDAAGLSLAHVAHLNIIHIKKLILYVQECAPIRLRGVHVLNTLPTVETITNILKPFIKAKLFKKVYFHTSMETFKEFVPIEALPNELGGTAGPIEEITGKNLNLLEEFRDYFQYDELNGRVNESMRVDKYQILDDYFGVDGTFRKLEVD